MNNPNLTNSFTCPHLQIEKHYFKCEEQHQAIYYCENCHCQEKYPFLCAQKKCLCQDQHKMCSKKNINKTIKKIQSKLLGTQKLNHFIQKTLQKMTKQIQKLQTMLTSKIDSDLKYANLSPTEKNFIKCIQSKFQNFYFCGANLSEIYRDSNKNPKKTEQMFQNIAKLVKRISGDGITYIEYIEDILNKYVLKIKGQTNNEQKKSPLIQKYVSQNFPLIQKKMVTQDIIYNLFKDKPTHSKVLFRASDFGFNMKKFYDVCQKTENILIICLPNNSDKIIGGFSTTCFRPKGKVDYCGNQWVRDQDKGSFLFVYSKQQNSLRKAKIKQRQFTIRKSQDRQVIEFGLNELLIVNKANSLPECKFILKGLNYNIPKNFENSKELQNFTTVEWQAWKIEWDFSESQTTQNLTIINQLPIKDQIIETGSHTSSNEFESANQKHISQQDNKRASN